MMAAYREHARQYGATMTRSISGTSAQSSAISGYDEVRLYNGDTAVCFITTGANPTATTGDMPIGPGQELHMQITDGHKIAVIGTAGTLFITPSY